MGFRTWGNADAMAQKSNYRGRDFKIIRNTKDFVPQPGDWGVWTGGWAGHVNIVVGMHKRLLVWCGSKLVYK